MFPSRNFFILLILSNAVVFFLVHILLVILSSFDILNSVDILNLFDISNLNIIFALLITDFMTIIIQSIYGNRSFPINNLNLRIFTIPSVNVPLSVIVFVFAFILSLLSILLLFSPEKIVSEPDDSQSPPQEEIVSEPDDSLYVG